MGPFTISLDDPLARQFDAFTIKRGYSNRSEAVRDLIRGQIGDVMMKKIRRSGASPALATSTTITIAPAFR